MRRNLSCNDVRMEIITVRYNKYAATHGWELWTLVVHKQMTLVPPGACSYKAPDGKGDSQPHKLGESVVTRLM